MKKLNFLFLIMAAFLLLSISCSSAKKSSKKGGGWYKNRNVNQLQMKGQESFVYHSEEGVFECLSKPE